MLINNESEIINHIHRTNKKTNPPKKPTSIDIQYQKAARYAVLHKNVYILFTFRYTNT
jgi:hypothetical protein